MPQKQYRKYPSTLQKNLQATQTQKPHRWIKPVIIILLVAGVIAAFILYGIHTITKSNNTQTAENAAPQYDKTQFSLDDPTSPWIVVNKQRQLNPKTYTPADLRAPNIKLKGAKTTDAMKVRTDAATALEALTTAAKNDGVNLMLISGYRSFADQKVIYDSEVRGFGQAVADQESARPGYSEHQTGWAADLGAASSDCEIEACFADTPEGKWLAANAYKYGFVIRYAKDKTNVTGYVYEPWHLRYVGTDLATEMNRTGAQTLEEFFALPPAPTY